jgi:hypothetical protein
VDAVWLKYSVLLHERQALAAEAKLAHASLFTMASLDRRRLCSGELNKE